MWRIICRKMHNPLHLTLFALKFDSQYFSYYLYSLKVSAMLLFRIALVQRLEVLLLQLTFYCFLLLRQTSFVLSSRLLELYARKLSDFLNNLVILSSGSSNLPCLCGQSSIFGNRMFLLLIHGLQLFLLEIALQLYPCH